MRQQSGALLNQRSIRNVTRINPAEDFTNVHSKPRDPRCKDGFHEARAITMRNAISQLQHQLNEASDLISTFQCKAGKGTIAEDERAARLDLMSEQVGKLLAGRRDVQLKLSDARLQSSTYRSQLNEILASAVSSRNIIVVKLTEIGAVIKLIAIDDDNDLVDSSCLLFKSSPIVDKSIPSNLAWIKPEDTDGFDYDNSENFIHRCNESITADLEEVYSSLDLKLRKLNITKITNTSEMMRLQAIVDESTEQILQQRQEIISIKNQIETLRADIVKIRNSSSLYNN